MRLYSIKFRNANIVKMDKQACEDLFRFLDREFGVNRYSIGQDYSLDQTVFCRKA